MKITGTRSYMRVQMDDGRIVKIDGELVVGGFVAESESIKNGSSQLVFPLMRRRKLI